MNTIFMTVLFFASLSFALAADDPNLPTEALSNGILSCADGDSLRAVLLSDQIRNKGHQLTGAETPSTVPRLITYRRKVSIDQKTIEDCYHTVPGGCDSAVYTQQLQPAEELRSAEILRQLVEVDKKLKPLVTASKADPTHADEIRTLKKTKTALTGDATLRHFMCSCRYNSIANLTKAQANAGCSLPRNGENGIKVLFHEISQAFPRIKGIESDPLYSVEQLSCQWKQVPSPASQTGAWEKLLRDDLHLDDLLNRLGLKRAKQYMGQLTDYLDRQQGTVAKTFPNSWSEETRREVKAYLAAHPELVKVENKPVKRGVKMDLDHGVGAFYFVGNELMVEAKEGQNSGITLSYHPKGNVEVDAHNTQVDTRFTVKYSTPISF